MSQEVQSVRILKFIVISMGVVLIFGTLALFAILIKKSKDNIKLCSHNMTISLPTSIHSFQRDDYSISFLSEPHEGTQTLSILDLCTGTTQTIEITTP